MKDFRAMSNFFGNHVKENKKNISREVSKITSRKFYKTCVLSKVFLTQKLHKTTNDVLAKIYILFVYYKSE